MGTAFSIMHLYLKQNSFTEIDRYLVAGVALHLACKIDYQHFQLNHIIEQYIEERKKQNKKRKIIEINQIMDSLVDAFHKEQVKILVAIEFDMEFDLPVRYVRHFSREYLLKHLWRRHSLTLESPLGKIFKTVADTFTDSA
jgi:hypothetical protein